MAGFTVPSPGTPAPFTAHPYLPAWRSTAAHVAIPGDLESALEAGVKAEIDNIAMYQAFLGSAAAAKLSRSSGSFSRT